MKLLAFCQSALPMVALALTAAAPVLIALGALGCRLGVWDWRIGLVGGVGLSFVVAIGAATVCICGVVATLVPPLAGRGLFLSCLGLLVSAMILGRIAMVAALAAGLPPINDIRTSESPLLLPIPDASNTVIRSSGKWGGMTRAEAQAVAYDYIAPLQVRMPLSEAVSLTERVAARRLGWDTEPPEMPDAGTVRIRATAVSSWYGFIDDIVIVILGDDTASVIEIRSASRVGRSDLGANARRIKSFLDDMLLASSRA